MLYEKTRTSLTLVVTICIRDAASISVPISTFPVTFKRSFSYRIRLRIAARHEAMILHGGTEHRHDGHDAVARLYLADIVVSLSRWSIKSVVDSYRAIT